MWAISVDLKWTLSFNKLVEKATTLARLLETDTVLHNKTIHTALAHLFCLLIGSLEDINAAVAQRASQYLETIKMSSIKVR